MASLQAGNKTTLYLNANEVLTVTPDANGGGSVIRLSDLPGGSSLLLTALEASTASTFGPFPQVTRFAIECTASTIAYSTGAVDLTDINLDGGTVGLSPTYGDAGSFQPLWADLNLEAGAGTSGQGDTSFLAPMMGNVLGADLTKTHNYLAGVIGADSATGAKATSLQKGAVLGIVMDGVTEADAPVVSIIDGSDPSSATRATAFFAARMNNNSAGSGADYGVDLFDAGRDETLYTGGGLALAIAKAWFRFPGEVCVLGGSAAPTDGGSGTGSGFAADGSIYIRQAGADSNAYINVGSKASPTWKLFTRAA